MASIALDKKKKYFICIISILMVSLLLSGTVPPVHAGATDQLDQWYVRHDPDLTASEDYGLYGITYGNGKFVAVGNCYNDYNYNYKEPILTSTDGTNWEEQVSGVGGNSSLNAVTFGNGKFVAVGMGGLILTSTDGETWTIKNQYNSGESSLLAVAYGNDTFVAAGVSGTTWTSTDGESRTKMESLSFVGIKGIIYNKNTFVMVGQYGNIWTSTDGENWMSQSSGTDKELNDVVFGNDIFTVVGGDGTILTSTDGVHWENHSFGAAGGILNGVAFGSGTFVAVSRNSAVLTSTNGVHWTKRNTGITEELSGVAYGNYTFCIGGSEIFQSENLGPVVSGINPASGPEEGGTTVTVSGSNLSVATAVYFGDTKADGYNINADTSLSAVSPSGTGTVQVKVWGQEGASTAISDNLFTYISPTPAISKQPSDQTVAAGQTATGVNSYTMEIPAASLSDSRREGTLTFSAALGSLTISNDMLTGNPGTEGKEAGITIGQGDKNNLPEAAKAAVGDRPLIQLSLTIDQKQMEWNNPKAPVTISIPYTPTESEMQNPESIIIWYIDGSGNAVSVPNGHYDSATGTVIFTITHFSCYAVGYNKVSFGDVTADAWYSKAVGFIAARGITSGTGSGNFSPEAKLTRGQFIVMLMNAYGIAPDADPKDNFTDAGNTYYTGYLAAAKRLGISGGVGDNIFAPGKEITLQEMFTLLYNVLKGMNRLPEGNTGKSLSSFNDAGQIASWANEAMEWMVESGTINGSDGKLSPVDTTTRAQMAQVLYNLLVK